MRIEGPNKTTDVRAASKAKKSGASGSIFSSLLDDTEETDDSSPVTSSNPLGSLDVLLAVQEDSGKGSKEANGRAVMQGQDLLDKLDDIKNGILLGTLSVETLQNITQSIAKRREQDIDPKLSAILDEIDLRAQVELAKFSK